MRRTTLNKQDTPKPQRLALFLITLLLLPSIAWAERYQISGSDGLQVKSISGYTDYSYAWEKSSVIKWFIKLSTESGQVSGGETTLQITLTNGQSVSLAASRPTNETGYFRSVKLEGLNQNLTATATLGSTTLTRKDDTFEPSAPIQWDSNDKITIKLTNNTSSSISCTISSITILTGTPSSTTFSWADQITSSQGFDVSKISISGSGDNITLSGICVENTTYSFPLNPTTGSPTITYSSSNPEVAEVNSSSGDVTVKKTGEATITAIPVESDTYYYLPSSYSYTLNISETYQFLNLRIAGTALTSGNVNSQTGAIDGIDGVTFDAQNKILTLENATITSTNTYAIESDLQNLEIKIKGINKLSSGNNAAIHSTNSSGVLSINQYDSTPSSVLLLSGESMSAITGFGSFNTSYKSYYIDANQNQTTELTWSYNSGVLNISGGSYLQNVIFSSITSCGITVGNVRVTNYNANNITGGGITVAEGGKVSYSDGILTLNNATINGRIMTTNPSLTIDLIGSSTISADTFAIKGAIDGALSLTFKSDAVPTLIIENSNNNIGLTSVINSANVTITYLNGLVATGLNTTHAVIAKSYGLNIAGTEVTNANAENITGDNKVAFSASTNTLTLTNAAIHGSIQYTGNSDMTVVINGTNIVGSNSTVSELINTDTSHTAKLTIKKGSDNSSLGFDATSSFNGSSISGFADVTLDGVYLQSESYCRYVTNDGYKDISNNKIHKLTFTTVPQYQLWVADTQVNEDNKGHILGTSNTTVTFTPASTSEDPSILTLNNATISGSIKSSLNDLTIEVAGSSNTLTAILYEGSSTSSTLLIKTPSSSSTVNKLTLENSTGAVISGFSTVTLDGLFFSTPNYPSVTTSTNWTSSINEAIITNEYGITVASVEVTTANKDDVLNDGGKVKFTPADNTASPATPATLTLNGAKITGTISWTNSAPLTIAINGTNSVTTTGAYAIEGNNQDNTTLTIAKVSETGKCKLILSGSTGGSISGFKNSSDTYAGSGLVYYEDQAEHTATILSTLSGSGTSTDPYLIETPEDLKDFSFFVNKQIITNKYIKIANNIDCKDLEGFESIGSSYPFMGTLSGYGNTISNLTINSGLGFFGHISGGIVNDLNFYKLSVKGNSYATGGIASELSAGGQIDNCTLTECTIACLDNQYSPEVGGIVARLSDSGSKISNCVVYNSTINASTTYTGGSGPIGYAGGIVASYSSGTITNCHVKDGSKIINVNADGGSTLKTGALVGNMSSETTTSITSNFYYYDVTVETQLGSSDKETKSGYTPRGTNDNTEDPTGAMLYTKDVIIPISTDAGHVSISSDYYYKVSSDNTTNTTYSIAPDVEVVISVENADVEGSYTLENETKTIELNPKEGSTGLYTFDMPNADVTFTVQEAAAVHFSEEGQIYVTYYNATKDVAVPMGMTAYIVTGVSEDGTKVIVSPVSYIKKGVAVLIEKDKTTEVSETTDFSSNKLIYAENDVPVTTESKLYVLYQNQFVKVTSGTQIPTGKNYLDLSTFTNAGTRGFYDIGGANDGTSALRGVVAEGTNGKSDAWYTLQGRRLSAKPTKSGLYLHNGIKVVIK